MPGPRRPSQGPDLTPRIQSSWEPRPTVLVQTIIPLPRGTAQEPDLPQGAKPPLVTQPPSQGPELHPGPRPTSESQAFMPGPRKPCQGSGFKQKIHCFIRGPGLHPYSRPPIYDTEVQPMSATCPRGPDEPTVPRIRSQTQRSIRVSDLHLGPRTSCQGPENHTGVQTSNIQSSVV